MGKNCAQGWKRGVALTMAALFLCTAGGCGTVKQPKDTAAVQTDERISETLTAAKGQTADYLSRKYAKYGDTLTSYYEAEYTPKTAPHTALSATFQTKRYAGTNQLVNVYYSGNPLREQDNYMSFVYRERVETEYQNLLAEVYGADHVKLVAEPVAYIWTDEEIDGDTSFETYMQLVDEQEIIALVRKDEKEKKQDIQKLGKLLKARDLGVNLLLYYVDDEQFGAADMAEVLAQGQYDGNCLCKAVVTCNPQRGEACRAEWRAGNYMPDLWALRREAYADPEKQKTQDEIYRAVLKLPLKKMGVNTGWTLDDILRKANYRKDRFNREELFAYESIRAKLGQAKYKPLRKSYILLLSYRAGHGGPLVKEGEDNRTELWKASNEHIRMYLEFWPGNDDEGGFHEGTVFASSES